MNSINAATGKMVLPFIIYDGDDVRIENIEVNVVYTSGNHARFKVVIVEFDDGNVQDYYYNPEERCFKQLSEDNDTMGEWWEEECVGEDCPSEYCDRIARNMIKNYI